MGNSRSGAAEGFLSRTRAINRRVAAPTFVVPERRTGFDRRHSRGLLQRVSTETGLLLAVVALLNVLSLADWLLTVHLLGDGAVEANLVLRGLSDSPLALGAVKSLLMVAVSAAIWVERRFRLVVAVGVGAVGACVLLVAYELVAVASTA